MVTKLFLILYYIQCILAKPFIPDQNSCASCGGGGSSSSSHSYRYSWQTSSSLGGGQAPLEPISSSNNFQKPIEEFQNSQQQFTKNKLDLINDKTEYGSSSRVAKEELASQVDQSESKSIPEAGRGDTPIQIADSNLQSYNIHQKNIPVTFTTTNVRIPNDQFFTDQQQQQKIGSSSHASTFSRTSSSRVESSNDVLNKPIYHESNPVVSGDTSLSKTWSSQYSSGHRTNLSPNQIVSFPNKPTQYGDSQIIIPEGAMSVSKTSSSRVVYNSDKEHNPIERIPLIYKPIDSEAKSSSFNIHSADYVPIKQVSPSSQRVNVESEDESDKQEKITLSKYQPNQTGYNNDHVVQADKTAIGTKHVSITDYGTAPITDIIINTNRRQITGGKINPSQIGNSSVFGDISKISSHSADYIPNTATGYVEQVNLPGKTEDSYYKSSSSRTYSTGYVPSQSTLTTHARDNGQQLSLAEYGNTRNSETDSTLFAKNSPSQAHYISQISRSAKRDNGQTSLNDDRLKQNVNSFEYVNSNGDGYSPHIRQIIQEAIDNLSREHQRKGHDYYHRSNSYYGGANGAIESNKPASSIVTDEDIKMLIENQLRNNHSPSVDKILQNLIDKHGSSSSYSYSGSSSFGNLGPVSASTSIDHQPKTNTYAVSSYMSKSSQTINGKTTETKKGGVVVNDNGNIKTYELNE